jgi:hypothetical protein
VVAEYDGETRAAPESVQLVTVILGRAVRAHGLGGDRRVPAETVGLDVVRRFRARLGNETNVAVYADASVS